MNASMDGTQMMTASLDPSMHQVEVIEDDFALIGKLHCPFIFYIDIYLSYLYAIMFSNCRTQSIIGC